MGHACLGPAPAAHVTTSALLHSVWKRDLEAGDVSPENLEASQDTTHSGLPAAVGEDALFLLMFSTNVPCD